MAKKCLVCKKNIEDGATKCVYCGSHQNWKRHLALSTTVLSLFVALASVLAVGIPPIIKTLHREKSVIRGKLLNIGPLAFEESDVITLSDGSIYVPKDPNPTYNLRVEIFLTNLGDRAGHLKVGHVRLKFTDEVTAEGKIDFPDPQRSLKPNYQQIFSVTTKLGLGSGGTDGLKAILNRESPVIHASGGQIDIDVINYDLSEDKIQIPINRKTLRCEYSPKAVSTVSNPMK